jgi:hypothetical protein
MGVMVTREGEGRTVTDNKINWVKISLSRERQRGEEGEKGREVVKWYPWIVVAHAVRIFGNRFSNGRQTMVWRGTHSSQREELPPS